MKELGELLRKKALDDSSVYAIIESRFYPMELALVHDPTYPSVCYRLGTGNLDDNVPEIAVLTFFMHCYSERSYEQCFEIRDHLRRLFNFQNLTLGDFRVRIRENSTPSEMIIEAARGLRTGSKVLYSIVTTWLAQVIIS